MKQIKLISWLILLASVFLVSCQRESDLGTKDDKHRISKRYVSKQKQQELRQLFAKDYREGEGLRSNAALQSDREIAFEGLKPQWEQTKSFRLSDSINLIVTPLHAGRALTAVADGFEDLDQKTLKELSPFINRAMLIHVDAQKHAASGMHFALLVPNLDFARTKPSMISSNGIIPEGFDGVMYIYDLKGHPKYMYVYEKGLFTHVYSAKRKNELRTASEGWVEEEECRWVRIEDDYSDLDEGREPGTLPTIGVTLKKVCVKHYRYVRSYSLGDTSLQQFEYYVLDGEGRRNYGNPYNPAPKPPKEGNWKPSEKEVQEVLEMPLIRIKIKAMKNDMRLRTNKEERLEIGVWVYKDYLTGKIYYGKDFYGKPVPYEHDNNANIVPPSPMTSSARGEGVPSSAYPMFVIHFHTSLEHAPDGFSRQVGLSDVDIKWSNSYQIPVIAIDALVKGDNSSKPTIFSGNRLDETKDYIHIPKYTESK